jgi:hypothetical protein
MPPFQPQFKALFAGYSAAALAGFSSAGTGCEIAGVSATTGDTGSVVI